MLYIHLCISVYSYLLSKIAFYMNVNTVIGFVNLTMIKRLNFIQNITGNLLNIINYNIEKAAKIKLKVKTYAFNCLKILFFPSVFQ